MGDDLELQRSGQADEARLTDETRPVLGASYYWVLDLAGGYRGGGFYELARERPASRPDPARRRRPSVPSHPSLRRV